MRKTIAHLEELFVDKSDSHYTPSERKSHNAAIQKAIDAILMANEVDTALKPETQDFINKLEAFKKASSDLAAAWVALDDERVSLAPNRLYPFKSSFDEVAGEIKERVEDTTTRLITDSQDVFIVGEICLGGHLEVSWREGDNIMTFQSEEDAEAEIQDMLDVVKEAVKKGDMAEEYDREEYVILPARLDGDTLYFEYDDEHWKMGLLDERKTLI